jgi:ectoine hydroxylase-related dioxygenase (phytanoyl-CoA dioxygenase family)
MSTSLNQGSMNHSDLASQFEQAGYVVVRKLLSPPEIEAYKKRLQQVSGLTDADFDRKKARFSGFAQTDGVTKTPAFWCLIFHERLLTTLRDILGQNIRYTQHSDLQVHYGTVGWHRDSAHRRFGVGSDWDESREPYQIARVAVYLQTYAESGFAFGVIPGSHRHESKLTGLELKAWNLIRRVLKRPDLLPPVLTMKADWIQTEPGDCIIFDQRILHSGSHIRGPKYSMFLSYGVENEHSRNHRRYYLYERKELRYKDYPPELAERLRKANLYLEI